MPVWLDWRPLLLHQESERDVAKNVQQHHTKDRVVDGHLTRRPHTPLILFVYVRPESSCDEPRSPPEVDKDVAVRSTTAAQIEAQARRASTGSET